MPLVSIDFLHNELGSDGWSGFVPKIPNEQPVSRLAQEGQSCYPVSDIYFDDDTPIPQISDYWK